MLAVLVPRLATGQGARPASPSRLAYLAGYAAWLAYERDPQHPDAVKRATEVPRAYPATGPGTAQRWWDVVGLVGRQAEAARDEADRVSFTAWVFSYPGQVVVAYKGTLEARDFLEDGYQLLGLRAPQYELARQVAERVLATGVPARSGAPLVVTGHSLGGGLAQMALADVAYGSTAAWGFNPAQLAFANRDAVRTRAAGTAGPLVSGYRVEGDNVSSVGPNFIGHLVVVPFVPAGGLAGTVTGGAARVPGMGWLFGGFAPRHAMGTVMRGMVAGPLRDEPRANACEVPFQVASQLGAAATGTSVRLAVLLVLLTVLARVRAPTGWRAIAVYVVCGLIYPLATCVAVVGWVAFKYLVNPWLRGALFVGLTVLLLFVFAAEWAASALSTFFCTMSRQA